MKTRNGMKRGLSAMLTAVLLLTGCTAQNVTPAITTASPETTVAPETTLSPETTPAPETDAPIPTSLKAEIRASDKNLPITRLTTPITIEIADGVTVDLDYQGWPTICRGEGDTLYAVSSLRTEHIDPFGSVAFTVSEDGGQSWSDVRIIVDTPLDDRDAGICYLGNGHLIVMWFTHDASKYVRGGAYDDWQGNATAAQRKAIEKKYAALPAEEAKGGSYIIHSTDGGKTWGDVVQIPVTTPHGPVLMQDGRTLMVCGMPWAAQTVLGKGLSYDNLYVFSSSDSGYTWEQMSAVPLPPDNPGPGKCTEPSIVQLRDGSFVMAYRNAESNNGMSIYTARSADGVQWTVPVRVGEFLGGPPHLLQLKNGALLMTYGYRVTPQTGIRGVISYDGGETWGKNFSIAVSQQPSKTDLGYPTTVEMDDGTLITAYYDALRGDNFRSLLCTKWRLVEE